MVVGALAMGCIAAPPTRTTVGVAGRVDDGQTSSAVETRIAVTPLAAAEDQLERPVDFGAGYFINRAGTLTRQQGPFLELGFNAWQRSRKRRPGVVRLTIHGYGELVAESYPRDVAWGGGAGMSATLESVRFVKGARGDSSGSALIGGAAIGEIGYGLQVATGYRRVNDMDSWTTTVALSFRTPALAAIALVGGIGAICR